MTSPLLYPKGAVYQLRGGNWIVLVPRLKCRFEKQFESRRCDENGGLLQARMSVILRSEIL